MIGSREKHRASETNRDSGDGHRSAAWRFFNAAPGTRATFEPHFRQTTRITAANLGKHVRNIEEPVKAAHGKGDA